MIIASWNINSVRKRLPLLEHLSDESGADVICLQETKANAEHFPADAIKAMGFEHQAVSGFGGYNGVAILSKHPLCTDGPLTVALMWRASLRPQCG